MAGGGKSRPKTPVAMPPISPPLTRTMPIAPDPGAVATATIGVESAAGADEEKDILSILAAKRIGARLLGATRNRRGGFGV